MLTPLNLVCSVGRPQGPWSLTAGSNGAQTRQGFEESAYGTFLPADVVPFGDRVSALYHQTSFGQLLRVYPVAVPNDDGTFREIRITGTFAVGGSRTVAKLRSAASYTNTVGSTWGWPFVTNNDALVNGNVYTVVFLL